MVGAQLGTTAVIRNAPAKRRTDTPSPARVAKPEVRIFVSYSHKDEVARARLETHLAQLTRHDVSTWFDGDLGPGEALDPAIARELRRAHVFVALFSPDYLARVQTPSEPEGEECGEGYGG